MISEKHIEYLVEEYKKRIERHRVESYYNDTYSAGCQDAYEQVVDDLERVLEDK